MELVTRLFCLPFIFRLVYALAVFLHWSSFMPYPEHPQNSPNFPFLRFIGLPHLLQIFICVWQLGFVQMLEFSPSIEGAPHFVQILGLELQTSPVVQL